MLSYKEYEKSVFDWLMSKHEIDNNFTFSLRKRTSIGAEEDYFIGTERSKYFGMTFWNIPVAYPGSAGDLIDLFFKLKNDSYFFEFEFSQTKNPDAGQNTLALAFIEELKEELKLKFELSFISSDENKLFSFKIGSLKQSYSNLEELFNDLNPQLDELINVIDLFIQKFKIKNLEFIAERISIDSFNQMIENLEKRFGQNEENVKKRLVQDDENDEISFIKRLQNNNINSLFFLYETIDKITSLNNFDYEKATFGISQNRLSFHIGKRYVVALEKSKFKFITPNKYEIEGFEFELFKGNGEPKYFKNIGLDETKKHQNAILNAATNEIEVGYLMKAQSYDNAFFRRSVVDKEYRSKILNLATIEVVKENIITTPLNQILYGPPGTGKTFTLNNEYFPKYISTTESITKEQYVEDLLRKCSWWQVIAVVLYDLKKAKVTEISNHPWILQKVKFSNSNTIRPTIWGQLQSHTIESCPYVNVKSKQGPFIFNKTEDSFWEILDNNLQEESPEIIDLYTQLTNYEATKSAQINRYVFTTFHQSFGYEDFIEGIKPVLSEEDSVGEVGYRIEDGIFKELCKRAKNDPNSRYAIFIDEINRGNISAIFGELITLIETDKRAGMKNEISLTLPYSKESFSVPQNVDIYGTMNTADRSVEALDTALRRRFSFVEMLPKASLLKEIKLNDSEIDLSKLLVAINERIEVLVDRDHTIGYAFFIGVTSLDELRIVFKNKIIPLLQEYFYGDYHKMELIICEEFFNKPKINAIRFAVKSDSIDREGVVYHLKDIADKSIISDEQFNEMLKKVISGVE